MNSRSGISFIDFILSVAIISVLFTALYSLYWSLAIASQNIGVRGAAVATLDNQVELIRNIPYAEVGTVGGIPSGILPQTQSISSGQYTFTLQTTVLNIDDPFDKSPSSSPVADYKLVTLTASCPLCQNFYPISLTTTVSSNNLTSGTSYGSIFVYAINANGQPVSGANVQVVNASVTPSINFTDTTNASGVLELIGVPTSTQGYQIFVSKAGYSSAQTYPPGAAGNPNPTAPNITVTAQTVSDATFAIDHMSSLTVSAATNRCVAVLNEPFSLQGSKLIGINPNVSAFATSSTTGATGTAFFSNLAWDTYALALNDATQDIVGTIPFSPITVNPSSSQNFMFVLQPASDPSLLVTVADAATGAGIPGASVTISKGSFRAALTTDHAIFSQTNWSGGQYVSSNGIATGVSGQLSLVANASGTYSTSTIGSLISNTFDLGGSSSTFNILSWTPGTEPTSTGSGSVSFQVAANNDNATWNFIGPDGTSGSYFTATSTAMPTSLAGNRYFRYEVFLKTQSPSTSPTVNGVTVDFTANCVPSAQTLFTSLSAGTYLVDVTAPGYTEATTTAIVGVGEATTSISMVAD